MPGETGTEVPSPIVFDYSFRDLMKTWLRTEGGLSVLIGLTLTAIAALPLLGVDSFGWVVRTNVWLDPSTAMAPASKSYATLTGIVSLTLTYLFLSVVLWSWGSINGPGR
jgi:hypothetical protein